MATVTQNPQEHDLDGFVEDESGYTALGTGDGVEFSIVENREYYTRVLDYVRESYPEYGEDVHKEIAVFFSSHGLKDFMVSKSSVEGAIPEDVDNATLSFFDISRKEGKRMLREIYDQLRDVIVDGLLEPRGITPRPIRTVDSCSPQIQSLIKASNVLRPSPFPPGQYTRLGNRAARGKQREERGI